MVKRLLILGAGGHGGVVADVAEACGYDEIIFVDERWPALTHKFIWPVVSATLPEKLEDWHVAVAIGQNSNRLTQVRHFLARGTTLPTLVHPAATVSKHASLGHGTLVAAHAVVGVGARVGHGVIVNTAATVDHDCHVADGVHISPGAHLAGTVTVGECTWIGIGAVVREGLAIGAQAMVGAGAAVVAPVPDGAQVLGIPARRKS